MQTTELPVQHLPLLPSELDQALEAWRTRFPDMGVLALLPEGEKENLPVLQEACRRLHVPMHGAIFPALLVDNAFIRQGVLLFRQDEALPGFLIHDINNGPEPAEERIAQAILPALQDAPAGDKPTLHMIFDAMVPNIGSILEGLYLRLSDRVGYAGVNAGSETFQPMPCLFDTEQVIGNGVLCQLLPGNKGTVLAHGFSTPRHVMNATATEGNRIVSIDWRPAFDVYREIMQREYGIELTTENFYEYAVHFPFGIPRANQDVVIRIPVALNEDGSLFCVGEVPENAMLVLLKAPGADDRQCIRQMADGLEKTKSNLDEPLLQTFYCAGRRMHLGDDAEQELADLKDKTHARRLAGALSLGEIGSTGNNDYPMFHNATLVCTAWD